MRRGRRRSSAAVRVAVVSRAPAASRSTGQPRSSGCAGCGVVPASGATAGAAVGAAAGCEEGRHGGECGHRVHHPVAERAAEVGCAPGGGEDAVDHLPGGELGEALAHERGQPRCPRRREARARHTLGGGAATDRERAQAGARGGHVHPRAGHGERRRGVAGVDGAHGEHVVGVPAGERHLPGSVRRAGPAAEVARRGHHDHVGVGREPERGLQRGTHRRGPRPGTGTPPPRCSRRRPRRGRPARRPRRACRCRPPGAGRRPGLAPSTRGSTGGSPAAGHPGRCRPARTTGPSARCGREQPGDRGAVAVAVVEAVAAGEVVAATGEPSGQQRVRGHARVDHGDDLAATRREAVGLGQPEAGRAGAR